MDIVDGADRYELKSSASAWHSAKEQARNAMIWRAARGRTMSYTELCGEVDAISFKARDEQLKRLLCEISTEENAAGRGMLSAVVVYKKVPWPGEGFFSLARLLGRRVVGKGQFWKAELEKLKALHG